MRAVDAPQPSPDEPRRGPRRSLGRRIAALLAAALALAVVTIGVLVGNLDRPWVKTRVQRAVHAHTGVDIDYTRLRIRPLSGVTVEALSVRTPGELGRFAPQLARIGRVEVGWSASSLLGRGPKLERVEVQGVEVTLASDERGRTSFDAFSTGGSKERVRAPPSRSLSRIVAEALGAAPPVGRLDVTDASLTWVRIAGDRESDRFTLRGLAAHVEAERDGAGWRLEASAGSPDDPLAVELVRDPAGGSAQVDFALTAQVRPANVSAILDARVRAQTFRPAVTVRELAHVEAAAAFESERGLTQFSITRARAGDGAASLEAQFALPDAPGAPWLVHSAHGAVDLASLLRMMPAGLVPAELASGGVTWRASGLEVTVAPRVAVRGSVIAEGELTGVRLRTADGTASLSGARCDLTARADGGAATARASLALRGVRLAGPGRKASLPRADLRVDAARGSDGAWSGSGRMELGALRLSGPTALHVGSAAAGVTVSGVRFAPGATLPASGALTIHGEVASLEARTPQARARATSVGFAVDAPLRGPPFSARASARASLLQLYGAEDRLVASAPARVALRLDDLVPDRDRPVASRGRLHADGEVGALTTWFDATKHADAVDFALTASARGRSLAELLVPAAEGQAEHATSLSLSTAGRVERLSSPDPRIELRSELRLDRPGLRHLQADRVELALRSSGDLWRHRADGDLTLQVTGRAAPTTEPFHLTFSAALDRRRPSVLFQVASERGRAVAIAGSLTMDRARRVLRYDLDGRLEQLAALADLLEPIPALEPLDLSRLAVELAVHGTLDGVIAVGADGTIHASPDPLAAAAPQGTLEVRARDVRWNGSNLALDVPAASWRAELGTRGSRRMLRSTLEAEHLAAMVGAHPLEATGVVSDVSASFEGSLTDGAAEARQELRVGSLRHDLGAYPVADLKVTAAARWLPDGVVRISEVRVDNGAAGTTLELKGGIDRGFERRRFSLRGELQQDVARLWTQRETFEGRGRLVAAVRVHSSDMSVFHTRASLRLEDVNVRLPRAGVSVVALDGEIPITADVALEGRRVALLRGVEANPFAVHRFADQHPLISRGSFISAASIESPAVSVAPLAGNINVEQNLISLSQLEMGMRGGRVTGQCVLEWQGEESTVWAHLRASGVQSSHGEPFDGNAALVLSAEERSIDGRIEILRIGSRHLLDLLDLHDPHHTDDATNRIRHALTLGYPERVRIGFDHGFANLHIAFGGFAKLLTVGDLRGVPTGPLVDRLLAPLSKPEER